MRLTDLNPVWLEYEGRRIGFVFDSPTKSGWRQSCYCEPTPTRRQFAVLQTTLGASSTQLCDPACAWQFNPAIDVADFSNLTVRPSLDGSKGGMWHGFITNGEITP